MIHELGSNKWNSLVNISLSVVMNLLNLRGTKNKTEQNPNLFNREKPTYTFSLYY